MRAAAQRSSSAFHHSFRRCSGALLLLGWVASFGCTLITDVDRQDIPEPQVPTFPEVDAGPIPEPSLPDACADAGETETPDAGDGVQDAGADDASGLADAAPPAAPDAG